MLFSRHPWLHPHKVQIVCHAKFSIINIHGSIRTSSDHMSCKILTFNTILQKIIILSSSKSIEAYSLTNFLLFNFKVCCFGPRNVGTFLWRNFLGRDIHASSITSFFLRLVRIMKHLKFPSSHLQYKNHKKRICCFLICTVTWRPILFFHDLVNYFRVVVIHIIIPTCFVEWLA